MKLTADKVLSSAMLKAFLVRFSAGEPFEQLLPDWPRSKDSLLSLVRGTYSTEAAVTAYQALGYTKRTVHVAAPNHRARLRTEILLEIRRAAPTTEPEVAEAALKHDVEPDTIREIVKGRYASICMQEALAIEAQARQ
jgi:hypothetical protein